MPSAKTCKHLSDAALGVRIRENGLTFEVAWPAKNGILSRPARQPPQGGDYARDRDVLSAYCYTGAFEVLAAHAGARVSAVGIHPRQTRAGPATS